MTSEPWKPRKILAAIDADATAEWALTHAGGWARHFGAALAVLHVERAAPADAPSSPADIARELHGRVEAVLPSLVPTPELLVRVGRPGAEISAASSGADLLVLGTHGRRAVGRWVLGSVAMEVLRTTDVPVLLVHAPGDFSYGGALIAATDLSEISDAVVRYAGCLAAESRASLYLMHALPIGDHPSRGHVVMREAAMQSLRQLCERSVPATVEAELDVSMQMEPPAVAIAHCAERHHARLIVMGGHGASGWTKGFLGNVTARVLHETALPVLVVRRNPPENA